MGFEVGFSLNHFLQFKTLPALNNDRGIAIRHAQHFENAGQGANPVQVLGAGVFHRNVPLGHDPDGLGLVVGLADQADGFVATHRDGNDHPRKEDGIAQRQDGNRLLVGFVQAGVLLFLKGHNGDKLGIVFVEGHGRWGRGLGSYKISKDCARY